MKNTIKNLIATGILSSAVLFGASAAKAGLLMSDFAPTGGEQPCQAESGESDYTGILMADLASFKTGLLMSDRSGLLISDRSGLLMSDLVSDPNQPADCK